MNTGRPKRNASKVENYRQYHLSGELSDSLQGRVAAAVATLQSPTKGTLPAHPRFRSSSTPSFKLCGKQVQSNKLRVSTTDLDLVATRGVNAKSIVSSALGANKAGTHRSSNRCTQSTGTSVVNKGPTRDSVRGESGEDQAQAATGASHTSNGPQGETPVVNRDASTSIDGTTDPTGTNPGTLPTHKWDEAARMEELQAELQEQRRKTADLETQLKQAQLRAELEAQKRIQKEWEMAMDKVKEAEEKKEQEHQERLKNIEAGSATPGDSPLEWLRKLTEEANKDKPSEQLIQLQKLAEQQKKLAEQAKALSGEGKGDPQVQKLLEQICGTEEVETTPKKDNQAAWMDQLQAALSHKPSSNQVDLQKEVLRHFLVSASKSATPSGATTLKPELLKKLQGEQDDFSMADWLSMLNKQELGEFNYLDNEENKLGKLRSGMLDKATSNILHKEVWPQKNLMEDWADEEVDFKEISFEQLVAGEVRTIELCTEPSQILGRLRLLRRMAYAKLRGYE